MSQTLVVMDIGNVLVQTVPTAQYRALGRLTGLSWTSVAAAIDSSGIVTGFGTGRVSGEEFTDSVRDLLGVPALAPGLLREAWNAVIAEPDPLLASAAAPLAAASRLLLASNINPFHWAVARDRLARVGVTAPACLSFEVGSLKPDPAYFAALAAADRRVTTSAVFVDDRGDNVDAAVRHGMTGWLHRDSPATVDYLAGLTR
jgi:HAD superfamily hydrolase (TIGR01509 family)